MANYKSVIAAAVAVCMMAGGIFLDTRAAQNDSADVKETCKRRRSKRPPFLVIIHETILK